MPAKKKGPVKGKVHKEKAQGGDVTAPGSLGHEPLAADPVRSTLSHLDDSPEACESDISVISAGFGTRFGTRRPMTSADQRFVEPPAHHPHFIQLDRQDWVDATEVDARDVRDPVRLAAMVLVTTHVSPCGTGHTPDCELATRTLGHATFDDLLADLGIDLVTEPTEGTNQ